jgi:hypothetical protein
LRGETLSVWLVLSHTLSMYGEQRLPSSLQAAPGGRGRPAWPWGGLLLPLLLAPLPAARKRRSRAAKRRPELPLPSLLLVVVAAPPPPTLTRVLLLSSTACPCCCPCCCPWPCCLCNCCCPGGGSSTLPRLVLLLAEPAVRGSGKPQAVAVRKGFHPAASREASLPLLPRPCPAAGWRSPLARLLLTASLAGGKARVDTDRKGLCVPADTHGRLLLIPPVCCPGCCSCCGRAGRVLAERKGFGLPADMAGWLLKSSACCPCCCPCCCVGGCSGGCSEGCWCCGSCGSCGSCWMLNLLAPEAAAKGFLLLSCFCCRSRSCCMNCCCSWSSPVGGSCRAPWLPGSPAAASSTTLALLDMLLRVRP